MLNGVAYITITRWYSNVVANLVLGGVAIVIVSLLYFANLLYCNNSNNATQFQE